MTKERQALIDRFQKWLDTNPREQIIAAQCATIAEEYGEQLLIQHVMPSLLSLNFREMRKAKGLTLREVEETTGISNAYLSQLETGKIKSPGYETVKLLYDLYNNET